jgi:hypothetical protein
VGGLVGLTLGSIITESFATGAVAAGPSGGFMGGLVGCETPPYAISNSYWYDGSADGAKNCYSVSGPSGYGWSDNYHGNTGCTEIAPAEGVS